ncbi:hypothetical protein PN836_009370 [Ningiella sp. W23]|uniref:hypothetical protein n=1 Tax=Ningiella sp. W23 TaxID=3023715 RepID=UPI0037571516
MRILTILLVCAISILVSANSHANNCEAVVDASQLADIRDGADMFGNYANGWLFAKAGSMLCQPLEDSETLRCTSEDRAELVSMAKDRTLVSGIKISTSDFQEFLIYPDGRFECSDSLAGVKDLQKKQRGPQEVCDIFHDTLEIYERLEQSVLHTEFAGAKLFLRHGNIACTQKNESELVCLSDDESELILQAPGSPMRGIRTFGVETVEMQFDADGNLGCGALSELEKYRN